MTIPLPNGKNQFADANGAPYASGTLDMYIPGTTTRKNTYTNAARTALNANPIVLDSAGRCLIYGNGAYRQVLKDNLGNTIWDEATADGSSTALVVATYADARALVAAEVTGANSLVYIQGRTSTNDGGQGFYYWNTTSTATDDGGVYIQLSGVVTGRLIRFESAIRIRPEWYGALRDGATNDTAAFTSAAAAITAAGGGVLYLSPGTYNVLVPIASQICSFTSLNGVSIEGPDATIADQQTYTGTQIGELFYFTGCTNISVGRTGPIKFTAQDNGVNLRGSAMVSCFGQNANLYVDVDTNGGFWAVRLWQTSGALTAAAHTRGVRGNIKSVSTAYPLACAWSGDEVDLIIDANDCLRNFFIYGVRNVRLYVRSLNQQATANVASLESEGCTNVYINYSDRGTTSSTGSAAPAVSLGFTGPNPVTHRNIHFHFDVVNPAAGGFGTTFRVQKLDAAGNPDNTQRGHIMTNLTLSGYMSQQAGIDYADSQGTMTGTDSWSGIVLRELKMEGGAAFSFTQTQTYPLVFVDVVSDVVPLSGHSGGYSIIGGSIPASLAPNNLTQVTTTQIVFPATQVASAGVNTLDDYEEVAVTVDLQFGGSNTGITYTSRSAVATKVGRMVHVAGGFLLSSKGAQVGTATINGLPYAIANGSFSGSIHYNLIDLNVGGAYYSAGIFGQASDSFVYLFEYGDNVGATLLTDADFSNTTRVDFNFTYETTT